jgi:hypothetical protein
VLRNSEKCELQHHGVFYQDWEARMDAMDMNRNVQLDHLEGYVMRMDPQRARRVLGYCPNCRQASVKVRASAW